KHCNGVRLHGAAFRFRPLEEVEAVEGIATRKQEDCPDSLSSWDIGPWVRFCDLADGGFVVIELRHTYEKGWKVVRVGPDRQEVSLIVSWSFQAFLERALAGREDLDRLAAGAGRPPGPVPASDDEGASGPGRHPGTTAAAPRTVRRTGGTPHSGDGGMAI